MKANVVILGAGFAGVSCAWWLSRTGVKDIVVLEREEMPGLHSSGLNAGLARRYEEDSLVAPIASEGVDFILNPPKGFSDKKLIECNGSLLLNVEGISDSADHKIISRKEAVKMVPPLESAKFENAMWTPTDGIVDIHSYLWAFIDGAKANGVKFVTKYEINKSEIDSKVIVNATGAWTQEVGNAFGAEDLKIKPLRRHLYSTPKMENVDPKWPFVWDSKYQYYFRPESGGLLLGACDEEEVPPGTPSTNPKIREILAEKLINYCPALSEVQIAREWCGCRTFTPDRRPVIRFDNKIKNFYWIAALGGRGMTCASSAGRIAAEDIIKKL